MKILIKLLAGLILYSSGIQAQTTNKVFEFEIFSNNFKEYESFLAGRKPLEITHPDGPNFKRHTLELLVFEQALYLGGCECRIKYSPYAETTLHAREIQRIAKGQILSHPVASLTGDTRVNDDVLLSESILDAENFFVGFYTHHNRKDILAINNKQEISNLRYAVSRNWEIDRKVLANLGVEVVLADYWTSIMKMIMVGRADVILQPFTSREDFGFVDGDLEELFVPIPNYKLLFNHGRKYMVSKKHPQGRQFLRWLNTGIKILKENNSLARFNIAAGVINDKVSDWEIIKEF